MSSIESEVSISSLMNAAPGKAPRSLQELLMLRKGGKGGTLPNDPPSEPLQPAPTQTFVPVPEEDEMPSQSVSIPDEVSLFDILNNPMYASGAGLEEVLTSHIKGPSPVSNKSQEDLIELYSIIAMLKQENANLQKEVTFIKTSKQAQIQDMQKKHDEIVSDLKLELQNSLDLVATLQQENVDLVESLKEQSARSSQSNELSNVKADHQSLKLDYNKLKMEITVINNTNAKLTAEINGLKQENESLHRELEGEGSRYNQEITSYQAELSKVQQALSKSEEDTHKLRNELTRVVSDYTSLDTSYKRLHADSTSAKQRLLYLEENERDLQHKIYSLEREYSNLSQQYDRLQERQHSSNNNPYPNYNPNSVPPNYAAPPPRVPASVSAPLPPPSSYHSSYHAPPLPPSVAPQSHSHHLQPPPESSGQSLPVNSSSGRKSLGSALQTSSPSSLASLLSPPTNFPAHSRAPPPANKASPFATEHTSHQLSQAFDSMERELTQLMTEKTSLQEEAERLNVRGMKTLKDRTRSQQVEMRLDELSKDISALRSRLSNKPA